jgi:UPF0755 protein
MSKRNVIIGGIVLSLVLIAIAAPKIMLFLAGNAKSINNTAAEFYIKEPIDLNELANQLKNQGIIDDTKGFISVGEYKGLNIEKIALGKYLIESGTSFRALLNGFTINANGNGNAELEVEVTFTNCRDIYQMSGKLSKILALDSARLVDFLMDGNTLKRLGFTVEQLPALFIPDTYKMFYDTDEELFVDRMAAEFKEFWTAERKSKLKSIGLESPSQAVTLASIVYSEQSVNSDEWPIIAGLYLNRVNQGMKLQSDPTFKFCWGDKLKGVQRLLNIHRDIDCPFNTYKIKGLPPGPICLPSPKVVDAVLNRANVNYIYMCAKPDYTGRHNFAVSGAEHMKNADIFQKWLAAELRKKEGR